MFLHLPNQHRFDEAWLYLSAPKDYQVLELNFVHSSVLGLTLQGRKAVLYWHELWVM